MAVVKPFRALRPTAASAARVASPPYDVLNTVEARVLAEGNPNSFLHVTRPEIDLPAGINEHAGPVYLQARRALDDLRRRGVLVADPDPRMYVYAQRMGDHRQVGVVGCVSVDAYDRDDIRKHENTRADKENDRTRHIDILGAHDEPVFLAYRADGVIDGWVANVTREEPVYDFVAADGVEHTLWVMDGVMSRQVSERFETIPRMYIADGHHRCAAASRVHRVRAGQTGAHGVFPAVVFPDNQLQILPYNRLVRDAMGRGPEQLIAALGAVLDLAPAAHPSPGAPGAFGIYVGGQWLHGRVRHGTYDPADPVASLDVSLCQEQLLGPVFGITDPRRDARVDFVGGIRGIDELTRRVDSEGWSAAIVMHATRIDQLLAVSDAGRLMPPKSTWFEPKLRSGLFVHVFDDGASVNRAG